MNTNERIMIAEAHLETARNHVAMIRDRMEDAWEAGLSQPMQDQLAQQLEQAERRLLEQKRVVADEHAERDAETARERTDEVNAILCAERAGERADVLRIAATVQRLTRELARCVAEGYKHAALAADLELWRAALHVAQHRPQWVARLYGAAGDPTGAVRALEAAPCDPEAWDEATAQIEEVVHPDLRMHLMARVARVRAQLGELAEGTELHDAVLSCSLAELGQDPGEALESPVDELRAGEGTAYLWSDGSATLVDELGGMIAYPNLETALASPLARGGVVWE